MQNIDIGIDHQIQRAYLNEEDQAIDPSYTQPSLEEDTDPSFGVIPAEGIDPSFSNMPKPEELLAQVTVCNEYKLVDFLQQFPYLIGNAMEQIIALQIDQQNNNGDLNTEDLTKLSFALYFIRFAIKEYEDNKDYYQTDKLYIKTTLAPAFVPYGGGEKGFDFYHEQINIRKAFVKTYPLLAYFFNEEIPDLTKRLTIDNVEGIKIKYLKNALQVYEEMLQHCLESVE